MGGEEGVDHFISSIPLGTMCQVQGVLKQALRHTQHTLSRHLQGRCCCSSEKCLRSATMQ